MTPERRAELLAITDRTELVRLAEKCCEELGQPQILRSPEVGLVMIEVREPVCRDRFHLGEVVVTRAEVHLGGHLGWAMRPGHDRLSALAAAVCDAAAQTATGIAGQVLALCEHTEAESRERDRRDWAELVPTQVDFEEMD